MWLFRAAPGPAGVADALAHIEEIGYYIPDAPAGNPSKTIQINHAIVDDKGLIYANDRFRSGLSILRYTGSFLWISAAEQLRQGRLQLWRKSSSAPGLVECLHSAPHAEESMISVLVVDADDDALRTIGEILHSAGLGAVLASTGLHALTLFRQVPVDVVVVDLRLSDFAGIEMLRAFRDERSGVPVIVTGVASPGAAIEAGRLGAAEYLEKPLRSDQLVGAVLSHVTMVRHLRWSGPSESSWTNPQVLHAVKAIDDRYWDAELSVRSLARELGLSTEHLCRVLKRQTGGTFVALLRRARIRAACRLLSTTTLCMKEIAAHVGFTSPNRFARDFKKLCGISPSVYRLDVMRSSIPPDTSEPARVSES